MGIIKRQGVKQSIVNYAGVGIGAISILFIYPLANSLYGLILFLVGTANFLVPFLTFGVNALSVRFFPDFEDKAGNHRGFLPLLLVMLVGFFVIFTLLLYFFGAPLWSGLAYLGLDVQKIQDYKEVIWVLSFVLALAMLLNQYTSNFRRIVIPGILMNLLPKLANPVLILLIFYTVICYEEFLNGVVIYHLIILLGLFLYLRWLGEARLRPDFSHVSRGKLVQMGEYALYGILGSAGSIFAFRIDTIMVTTLIDFENTGIYGITQFIANAIEMPTRSIYAITGPIIAGAIKREDMGEVQMIYSKSSINLLIIGLLAFFAAWLSLDDIFRLSVNYEALQTGSYVFFFVGISKLVDMGASVNSQIIGYSRLYRYNLIAVFILGVANFVLNLWLIPLYGITGAALATCISVVFYNLFKGILIWWGFGIQPLSWATLAVLLVGLAAYGIVWVIPDFSSSLLNLIKNTVLLTGIYLPAVIILRLSPDFNQLLVDNWNRVRKLLFGR